MTFTAILGTVIGGLIVAGFLALLRWMNPLKRQIDEIQRDSAIVGGLPVDGEERKRWESSVEKKAARFREYKDNKNHLYFWGMVLFVLAIILLLIVLWVDPSGGGAAWRIGQEQSEQSEVPKWKEWTLLVSGTLALGAIVLFLLHPASRQRFKEAKESDDSGITLPDFSKWFKK